jgi:type I restriction enzyme S subunit
MLDSNRITGKHLAPYLRNVDVQWDRINTDELPEMDFSPDDRDRYRLRRGDLLVCEGGEVGRCATWDSPISECYYQKALHRLRPLTQTERPRFLYYCLRAAAMAGLFMAESNPNTIDHLTAEKLKKHRFPFPDGTEQAEIVAALDHETARIDAIVATTHEQIARF